MKVIKIGDILEAEYQKTSLFSKKEPILGILVLVKVSSMVLAIIFERWSIVYELYMLI